LLGINIPPFEYLQEYGRKMTNYEYNVETLDHWPWSKMFILMNNLNGRGEEDIDIIIRLVKEIIVENG
jgi:hypothetical protein